MAHAVHSSVLDAAFSNLKARAQRVVLLKGGTASYGQLAAMKMGDLAIVTAQHFSSPVIGGNAGRAMQIGPFTGIPITSGGNADHVAIVSDSEQAILLLEELANPMAASTGQPANIGAWMFEIRGLA